MFNQRKRGIVCAMVVLIAMLSCSIALGAEKITLSVQGWAPSEESVSGTWNKMEAKFKELNPNIDIEIIATPWIQTRSHAIIALAGGNASDIVQMTTGWVPPFVEMGALVPFDQYYTQEQVDDIPEMTRDSVTIDGKIYSAVWMANPMALVCNKTLWKNAGLPAGQGPETWDEFDQWIAKISGLGTASKKVYGYGARSQKSANSAFWFFPAMWAFGGNLVDEEGTIVFNSPETLDALNWYKKLAKNEYIPPVGTGVTEGRSLFTLDQVGVLIDSALMRGAFHAVSGRGEAYDNEYFSAPVPKGKDGKRHPHANNQVWVVFKQSKNQDAAMKLIKYITQDEEMVSMFYREVGFLPGSKSLLASGIYRDDFTAAFIDEMGIANALPSKNTAWMSALEYVAVAMQKALLGQDTAAAAASAEESIKVLYGQ